MADVSARPLDFSQYIRTLRRQSLCRGTNANQPGPTPSLALEEQYQPSAGSYFQRFNPTLNPALSLA